MKIVFVASLLCIIATVSAEAAIINEIMYNPAGSDYDYEYVELYLNETANLSSCYFQGIDFIFPKNTTGNGFLVIANSCLKFKEKYSIDCLFEFGGSLSNTGETVALLMANGTALWQTEYSNTAKEEYSLEITSEGWIESKTRGGTPGRENSNSFFPIEQNETNINETHNETELNQTENQTENSTSENETLSDSTCDASISIWTDKTSYQNKEQIKIKHILANEPDLYSIDYWIEDLFGEIVKSKRNTTNTNQKSYTPSIDAKEKILVIKSRLYADCNDTNLTNNYAEKTVFVVNENYEEQVPAEEEQTTSETTSTKKTAQKSAEISSFYTLAKTFEQNKTINVYSMISNSGQGSGLTLILTHNNQPVETQNLTLFEGKSQKISFETVLSSGNNSFLLELIQNSRILDSRELNLYAEPLNYTENNEPITKEKFINSTPFQESKGKEQSGTLKSSIAFYALLGLSAVFNVILLWKR
jgi:hypothetical protein